MNDQGRAAAAAPGRSGQQEWRVGRMPNLMSRRVQDILLVATPYDAFILEEDGLLSELIFSEYMQLGLSNAPHVTRVSTGEEALQLLRAQPIDLVISMRRLGDIDIARFTAAAREIAAGIPIVLLLPNEIELMRIGDRRDLGVDRIYVWNGDALLFLAIIKEFEDLWNVEEDTEVGGVGVIILIEDSVRYRSFLLPLMYTELVNQTRSVMADGLNRIQRLLRLRARPKILVADTFELGLQLFERYRDFLFGIVTDVSFPRRGRADPNAGIEFICRVHAEMPDVPALLQSSDPANREKADLIGVSFLHKRSSTMGQELRRFMTNSFGFGEFVFRLPDRTEVGRASDMYQMPDVMRSVPIESIEYHARRNHFSNWLRARSEFTLARRLRPRKVSEFRDPEQLRVFLVEAFEAALRENRRGIVEDFRRERFDAAAVFARLGGGSIGGKARGLAFIDTLLLRNELDRAFEGVRVFVPNSVVVGTDVFDDFLEANRLRTTILYNATDSWIRSVFLKSRLLDHVKHDLQAYLDQVRVPIAVRSSSLLEDSQHHPFAGVYDTHMIPNNDADPEVRFRQLCDAIKLVYASMFFANSRQYLEAIGQRIEEQKMAVILQPVCGSRHEHYFYPNFAGVVRSYNFYPFGHMKPEDGVAMVGLGLGKVVVEGGEALRFCPAHPRVLPQLSEPKQYLQHSQHGFYAIELGEHDQQPERVEASIVRLSLADAERHGTLELLGSTWDAESDALYDGIHRPGARVVSFAHLLKNDVFPLAEILQKILAVGSMGMSGPVELEFAVNLNASPREFAVLQIRPYGADGGFESVDLDAAPAAERLIVSESALGHGVVADLLDVVYVRPDQFDPARTPEIARQIAEVNERLRKEHRRYLLIGPGRWGSSNSWLGIPVNWAAIGNARIIVETCLDDFVVDPSQGSHFFHNLTSAGVAYLTVQPRRGLIDWSWLAAQPAEFETPHLRHLRLAQPLEVRLDGRKSCGVVYKRRIGNGLGTPRTP